jgi:diaminopimelate decarboxylase
MRIMPVRELPFSHEQIEDIAAHFPTPFYLYDEGGMRTAARGLNEAYDWVEGPNGEDYINYFAVKALSNTGTLRILRQEGMGADASDDSEIDLAGMAGLHGQEIMFTSNNTPPESYLTAVRAGAIINLDDIFQIGVLQGALGGDFLDTICFRYNPGNKKASGTGSIIGAPLESKFGVPDFQLEEAYRRAKALGVKHFGLHTMVASNGLDPADHIATARLVFEAIGELSESLGIKFEFANLGGGLGIPYRPNEKPLDYNVLRKGISEAYKELILDKGLPPLRIMTENGRHVTGPHGYVITRARSIKESYRRYVGLDANMAVLMRPGMYGKDAYHEIVPISRASGKLALQTFTGDLCENNDQFGTRKLPIQEPGDLLVILDAGAHSYEMGFTYNGKRRPPEYVLGQDGSVKMIRRRQTKKDLFATLASTDPTRN